MNIRWLSTAVHNRFEQLNYIAQLNPYAAIRLNEEIDNQIQHLMAFPELGKIGHIQPTRELTINRTPFILVYRIHHNEIQILRLLHQSQKWP